MQRIDRNASNSPEKVDTHQNDGHVYVQLDTPFSVLHTTTSAPAHPPFPFSQTTSATYIRSHCTLSLDIWLHRVKSNFMSFWGTLAILKTDRSKVLESTGANDVACIRGVSAIAFPLAYSDADEETP